MIFVLQIFRAAVAVSVLAATTATWAAEPLSLGEAQRLALERSRQMLAQDAMTRAAREQAVAAGQLPDPVLKFGIDNLPADGPDRFSLGRDFMTMRRIGIMQEIPRAEKRLLRAETFEREAERVQAQGQSIRAEVQRSTALAWVDRYYAQAQRELLEQQAEATRLQLEAVDSAYRTGKGKLSDVFAGRAAVIGLQDRLSQIDQQLRSAGLKLARWAGPEVADRPVAGPPPWQGTPWPGLAPGENLKRHPDLLAANAEVEAAETQARLAQADKKADVTVEASYAQRGPAFSNMLSIGVSIPWQWDQDNRQNRELGAKLARVDEARARYEDLLRKNEAETGSLYGEWQTGKSRWARFRDELVPVARQRTEATLSAYRTGKGDLAEVLMARRDEIDVRLQALALEWETARAWAQLHFLVPDSPMPMPAKDAS
jgi:outer membrane protein TolC